MGHTVRAEFAEWLRAQLRAQGWMVSDFAEQVGVRPSAVYRWTAGQRAPTDSQIDKIAAALKTSREAVWEALARSGVGPSPAPPRPTEPPVSTREHARVSASPGDRRFAEWLRGQVAERGWSTGALARRLDLDPVTVRAWITGARQPATVQYPRIAQAFDVSPETIKELIEG
ncbi:MAG: helix-turn-helix domain-containing protein [Chloroflexota bacterium]